MTHLVSSAHACHAPEIGPVKLTSTETSISVLVFLPTIKMSHTFSTDIKDFSGLPVLDPSEKQCVSQRIALSDPSKTIRALFVAETPHRDQEEDNTKHHKDTDLRQNLAESLALCHHPVIPFHCIGMGSDF